MTAARPEDAANSTAGWSAANYAYLQAEFERLRLMLRLRVLWLRTLWRHAPEPALEEMVVTDESADRLLNGDPFAAEARFYADSPAARQISELLVRQTERVSVAAAEVTAQGSVPALDVLTRTFCLEPFDRNVLLLCLAPLVDTTFERLYCYVQDDITRKYATPELAVRLLSTQSDGANWVRFAPTSSLRRFHLVTLETALRLPQRVADYLLGVNYLDEQAAPYLRPCTGAESLAREEQYSVDLVVRRLLNWKGRTDLPLVNFTRSGAGDCRSCASHVCSSLGMALFALDAARLPAAAPERHSLYRLLEREAAMLNCAYYLENTDSPAMEELARNLAALVFVDNREPLAAGRPRIIVPLLESSGESQRACWQTIAGEPLSDEFVSRLIQQFHFQAPQIQRAVGIARETAVLRDPESGLTEADLWKAARATAARGMDGLAWRIEPKRSLDDLVLPPESMRQIHEIASQVAHRGVVYEDWGFGANLSRGKGISALFAGASGTGKTMAAEALAQRLDLDLYRIDLAGVISKYIGETEKNLRRVFDAAEDSGAILFFDEADALFGKRSEVRDSHDRYANIEINYLLQRMEDYRGLAILATNRKSLLDPAFLRRLRFLVDFPFPAAAERVRIWRGAFPPKAELGPIDYEFLGKLEITGGNIANIALNAAFLAAGAGSAIAMDHVLQAAVREYAKIDKLVLQSEFGRYYSAVRK